MKVLMTPRAVPRMGIKHRVVIAVALAYGNSVLAETPAPAGTYECTQVAMAEDNHARLDSIAAQARSTPPLRDAIPDNSCWVTFAEANGAAKAQLTWIDVRPLTETRLVQLPGALSIPLNDVRGKQFLKDMPLVLVGSGRDDGEVAQACGELRESGFHQVQALRGGVRAWIAGGRSVLGDAAALQALDWVAPIDFRRQASTAPWQVIGVDLPGVVELPIPPSAYRTIAVGDDPVRIATELGQQRDRSFQQERASPTTAILVIARDERHTNQVRDALRGAGISDVLFLRGGYDGYRSFLIQQQNIAATAGKTLARPCGSS